MQDRDDENDVAPVPAYASYGSNPLRELEAEAVGAVAPCEGKGAGEAAEAPRGLRASEASKREAPASEPDGSNSEFSPS